MLRGLFGANLTVGPRLASWSQILMSDRLRPALGIRSALTVDGAELTGEMVTALQLLDEIEEDSELRLYPYQRVDLAFLIANQRSLLVNEPGLGKTAVVIRYLQVLAALGAPAFPAVIVCPNSLKHTVWAQELAQWAPELMVSVVDGGMAQRRKQLLPGSDVYVINYDAMRLHSRLASYGQTELSAADKKLKELNELDVKTFIADEVHRCKDPHAKQTLASWAVAQQSQFRVGMTGTPVANHLGDLWSLLRLVEPEWFRGKTKFVDRYAVQDFNFYGGQTILGIKPETRTELFQVIDPLIRRVPKKAALPQLPEMLPVQYRHTPMTPSQAKAYREMEASLIADLNQLLMAPDPLNQLTRLLQFASSYAEVDDLNRVRLTAPSNKVNDLVDLLEEMGDAPLVVAAVSRQLVEIAAAELIKRKISLGLVTGSQSPVERQLAVKRFQDGHDRVIMMTTGAGAEGLTLTRADTMLFMQSPWSLIQRKQAQDRIYRIGSEIHQSIRIIEQITPGTVEQRKLDVLAGKEHRLEEIVRDRETLAALLGVK
jgi:SNF2 family DNA or RNA helicase